MITYPRQSSNGIIDLGIPVVSSNTGTGSLCRGCSRSTIVETLSAESCLMCGHVVFDYWPSATSVAVDNGRGIRSESILDRLDCQVRSAESVIAYLAQNQDLLRVLAVLPKQIEIQERDIQSVSLDVQMDAAETAEGVVLVIRLCEWKDADTVSQIGQRVTDSLLQPISEIVRGRISLTIS